MLIGKGATPGPINDMWFQVLGLNGFTQPSLNDREFAFWTTSGNLTGSGADISQVVSKSISITGFDPTIVTTP